MLTIHHLKNADQKMLKDMQTLLAQLSPALLELTKERLAQAIEHKGSAVYVVKEEETIVGTATLLFCRSLSGGLHAFVEDVVVDEHCRGKGIGKMLMAHIIEVAKKQGVDHINLTSRPERQAANHLYQTLGFKKRETNMYRLTL